MYKIISTIFIILYILNPSYPAAIRPKFQNIHDFHHCLVTYLNSIGIIQYTNSQDVEQAAINCDSFHKDLKSSIENMYKLIKLNLYEALGDDGEAECMDEVFRYTKFMEYNVVATTTVQLQPNGFQELKNLLNISKNIFIYATMKCLISSEMIGELFQHFATQIKVDDLQFACVVQHVSENQLMEDFIVKNIDEFLNEKFMESSEENQAFTNNLQQVDDNSMKISAETTDTLIDNNTDESAILSIANTQETQTIGSEIEEAMFNSNEQTSDINEHVVRNYSIEESKGEFLGMMDVTTDNLNHNDIEDAVTDTKSTEFIISQSSQFEEINSQQITTVNSISTVENLVTSPITPDIISTKLKKKTTTNSIRYDDQKQISVKDAQQSKSKLLTTASITTITSEIDNEGFTPTASMLKSADFMDKSYESYEDYTLTSHEDQNKKSNFSRKFGYIAENMKNTDAPGMTPKKVMILERPLSSNIQKIPKSKKNNEKILEVNVTNEAGVDVDLIDLTTVKVLKNDNEATLEYKDAEDENITDQNSIENMTSIAKNFMQSNEVIKTTTGEEGITLNETTNEVTEYTKTYDVVSETSKTSAETSERSKELNESLENHNIATNDKFEYNEYRTTSLAYVSDYLGEKSTEFDDSHETSTKNINWEVITTDTTRVRENSDQSREHESLLIQESQSEGTIINTFDYSNIERVIEETTAKLILEQPYFKDIKSSPKKDKIVFKISNLPYDFNEVASKLLNKTKSLTGIEANVINNDPKLIQIIDDSNLNNKKTLTSSEENQSSEVIQVSSENSFLKLANSLKHREDSFYVPDSRIKRQIQSCPSIIENLTQKIKTYNIESMDDELNSCMSQLVNQHDIDDYFTFIVLKKYGSTEIQANEKNKKLMNMIMSFIGKYIECTDLYGFMEMAGFSHDDNKFYK